MVSSPLVEVTEQHPLVKFTGQFSASCPLTSLHIWHCYTFSLGELLLNFASGYIHPVLSLQVLFFMVTFLDPTLKDSLWGGGREALQTLLILHQNPREKAVVLRSQIIKQELGKSSYCLHH